MSVWARYTRRLRVKVVEANVEIGHELVCMVQRRGCRSADFGRTAGGRGGLAAVDEGVPRSIAATGLELVPRRLDDECDMSAVAKTGAGRGDVHDEGDADECEG